MGAHAPRCAEAMPLSQPGHTLAQAQAPPHYEQPVVSPQAMHFRQLPFLTNLNCLQLGFGQGSPSKPDWRAISYAV